MVGASSSLNLIFSSGSVNGDGYERDTESITQFSVMPQVAYAISNNFFIGIDFSYVFRDEDNMNWGYESTTNTIVIAPSLKYYFSKNKFKPFLVSNYGFGVLTDNYSFNSEASTKKKLNLTAFSAGGGIAYFITPNISTELSIKYLRSKIVDDGENTINKDFNTNIGFYIFL